MSITLAKAPVRHKESASGGERSSSRKPSVFGVMRAATGPALALGSLIQRKLAVGRPGDRYEREADAAADSFTSSRTVPNISRLESSSLQTLQPQTGEEELQRQEMQEDEPLQMQETEAVEWQMQREEEEPNEAAAVPQEPLPGKLDLRLDWFEMTRPFATRGAQSLLYFDINMYDAIGNAWNNNYNFFFRFGLGDRLSADAANFFTPFAIDTALKHDFPTAGELFEREADVSSIILNPTVFTFDLHDIPGTLRSPLLKIFGGSQRNPYAPVQRKCVECEEELQRSSDSSAEVGGGASFERALRSSTTGGSPLSEGTRNAMERHFGADFSSVRVHTGSTASSLSASIQARAFTHGNHIYFRNGHFSPGTAEGSRLLAHELTHVVQQVGSERAEPIQRDFAIEPPRPDAVGRALTARQMQSAIAFNVRQFPDPAEIALVRDIIGLSRDPAVIDEDFVNAIATYQAQYAETSDGKVGRQTMALLAREARAAGASLEASGVPRGALDVAFALVEQLDGFITAGTTTYRDYRDAIRASTPLNRTVGLVDEAFMRRLRDTLTWNSFARSAELLGRFIPNANQLLRNPTVRATLDAAWTDSDPAVTIWAEHDPDPAVRDDPCNPPPGGAPATAAHEEGGWVYLNLITGAITTRRAAAGAQAGILLNAPPAVADSVIIATFHTHPNVGACWSDAANPVFPSDRDIENANERGMPNLIRGAFPDVNDTIDIFGGPVRRRHLAGDRPFPGPAGGLAPQANIRGKEPNLE